MKKLMVAAALIGGLYVATATNAQAQSQSNPPAEGGYDPAWYGQQYDPAWYGDQYDPAWFGQQYDPAWFGVFYIPAWFGNV